MFSFYSLFRANTLLLATVVICIKIVGRITPNFYFKILHSFSSIMLVGLNIEFKYFSVYVCMLNTDDVLYVFFH